MGTLTAQPPFSLRSSVNGFSRPYFGFSFRQPSPSPVRRKLFPDSNTRSLSSALAYPILEDAPLRFNSLPPTFPPTDGLPPRKFSSGASDDAVPSRRSSRAASPFDDYGSSRRSSRASSPFTGEDLRKRRPSRRMSRSSRGSSPFDPEVTDLSRKKGSMQMFMDSLRSRTPSPSGRSHDSPSRRRSSSLLSDLSNRLSNSPYHTLPRRRSQSPDVRAMSVSSDSGNTSISNNGSVNGSNTFPKSPIDVSTPSPSARADGEKVDRAIAVLRQLSEDWSLTSEKEEEENQLDQLDRSSNFYKYFNRNARHGYRRSSSTNSPNNIINHFKNNNNNKQSVDPSSNREKSPLTENALAVASHLIEIANRRSPSPPKTFAKPPVDRRSPDKDPIRPTGFINGYSPFLDGKTPGHLSAPARLDEKQKNFLPFTFPEQSQYRAPTGMATTNGGMSPVASPSPRKFSEESSYRRPLATLHEDEVMARRRFSEDVVKRYYDTSEVADELYNHQRRLSEAGVKKISDASTVLTEDTDQFMIGQRVWVGGSKPGVISFIGETQFAPGDWAGVTLDEPNGKNDGSVGGVRYFQCEPRKGVFSRLTRLSLVCLIDDYHDREQHDPRCARNSLSPARSVTSSARSSITPTRKVSPPSSVSGKSSVTPKTPMGPPSGASVARKVSNPTPAVPSLTSYSNLTIGDRVIVNSKTGTRVGTLRHLGKTEFADGLWAGVELDEPTGKNDGSVAGKKYFSCKPKYGLFSPLPCISKVGTSSSRRTSTPSSRLSTTPLRRSNSRESLGGQSATSSIGASSVASSVKPTYRKTSYGPSHTAARIASSKAMQDYYNEAERFY